MILAFNSIGAGSSVNHFHVQVVPETNLINSLTF